MGVPMVGFGFIDNLVMIQAGDFIDSTIGVTFGLATLTSAAYGQIVSDVSGTISGSTVEALASSLGLPRAELTLEQLNMPRVRFYGMAGAVFGVACGCLLGMSCLLFMDLDKSERLKRQGELRTLYSTLMEEGHELIGAQHCALFLLDEKASTDGDYYLTSMGWTGKQPTRDELERTFVMYDTDSTGKIDAVQLYQALRKLGWVAELSDVEQMIAGVDKNGDRQLDFDEFCQLMKNAILADEVRLKVRKGGSRHRVLATGETLNVRDVQTDPRINDQSRARYGLRGYDVRSLLLAPVLDGDGKVVGLIELVNKEIEGGGGTSDSPESTVRHRPRTQDMCPPRLVLRLLSVPPCRGAGVEWRQRRRGLLTAGDSRISRFALAQAAKFRVRLQPRRGEAAQDALQALLDFPQAPRRVLLTVRPAERWHEGAGGGVSIPEGHGLESSSWRAFRQTAPRQGSLRDMRRFETGRHVGRSVR